MRKLLSLFIIIFIASLSACSSETIGILEPSQTNINENENLNTQTGGADSKAYNINKTGLEFPHYSTTTEYNGYTYELVNEKKEDLDEDYHGNIYTRTLIYRYADDGNKQEWHVLDGRPGIMGIFNGGKLVYLQYDGNYDDTGRLKRLDLQTLIAEELMVKNGIEGMFQYDNYIMLMCGGEIIRYDLLQNSTKSIIDADSMGNDCDLDDDNVFACNDKMWIVVTYINGRHDEPTTSKIFSSDLDGNNLSYTGISLLNFYGIVSVSERESTLTYNEYNGETDENQHMIFEKRTVSLNDKIN